ncbi:MAG: c-type cytochrome biogenesis protein CcmI [Paracoccaceae bacterium]
MEFWIIAAAITALVGGALALSALARRGVVGGMGNDVQVYRDQLDEVSRDQARGVINPDEADRLRLEVSRRLLDADRNTQTGSGQISVSASPFLAGVMVLALFGGAFLIYGQLGKSGLRDLPLATRLLDAENTRLNRASQAEAEATAPTATVPTDNPEHQELMVQLRAALKTRPEDLQGHTLLAQNEAGLGNFVAAHQAQARVLTIKGDGATANDFANYADLLALAANGYVSPEAEAAVDRSLALDENNGSAHYYRGLLEAQIGRPDLAFNIWRTLLEQSLPDAPWVPPIRAQIGFVAADAGIRYDLPDLQPGPSVGDVAAAQDMSAEERDTMIRGMVEQLSARLADEGGSAQEWARLIGALGVLGETERASAIWNEAKDVFAASPEQLATVRQAAARAGVAN